MGRFVDCRKVTSCITWSHKERITFDNIPKTIDIYWMVLGEMLPFKWMGVLNACSPRNVSSEFLYGNGKHVVGPTGKACHAN